MSALHLLLVPLVCIVASAHAQQDPLNLIFTGDIMLAELPGKAMARGGDPFSEFADLLHAADAAVGNLECVVASGGQAIDKPWTFEVKAAASASGRT
ncbi:MAG: CapA family protein [Verrucomicrobia bacterium]|nr:CapA family protein [Verrucomicrobiota bacterium]